MLEALRGWGAPGGGAPAGWALAPENHEVRGGAGEMRRRGRGDEKAGEGR